MQSNRNRSKHYIVATRWNPPTSCHMRSTSNANTTTSQNAGSGTRTLDSTPHSCGGRLEIPTREDWRLVSAPWEPDTRQIEQETSASLPQVGEIASWQAS